MFANLYMAYETLSPAMQRLLEPLGAIHDVGAAKGLSKRDPANAAAVTRMNPPIVHPLVRIHPETQRKALFVTERVRGFEGMTEEESRPLLDFLNRHAVRFTLSTPTATTGHAERSADVGQPLPAPYRPGRFRPVERPALRQSGRRCADSADRPFRDAKRRLKRFPGNFLRTSIRRAPKLIARNPKSMQSCAYSLVSAGPAVAITALPFARAFEMTSRASDAKRSSAKVIPERPIDEARSPVPIQMISIPSTSRISSRFLIASLDSMSGTTTIPSFVCCRYSFPAVCTRVAFVVADSALAGRCVSRGGKRAPQVVRGVDVGDDHAGRAGVQRFHDLDRIVLGNPRQRNDPAYLGSAYQMLELFEAGRRVFHVERGPSRGRNIP